jgi:hypothetical protein
VPRYLSNLLCAVWWGLKIKTFVYFPSSAIW